MIERPDRMEQRFLNEADDIKRKDKGKNNSYVSLEVVEYSTEKEERREYYTLNLHGTVKLVRK